MKPIDPIHSKALEEKIKKLVDGLVEKADSLGDIVSEDSQTNISTLLMRLALKQDSGAYEAAVTRLMSNTLTQIAKIKFQLNILLVQALQELPEKGDLTPVKRVKPKDAPAVKPLTAMARFFNKLMGIPEPLSILENETIEEFEETEIFILPKDYGWVELLIDAVLDSMIRDHNQSPVLGFSRILGLRNELEEEARNLDRTSVVFGEVSQWVLGLNQVIMHAQPHSFAEHCHHFEYRQHMLKKNGLLAKSGDPLYDTIKNALVYYADHSSLLEDVMDINACRLLRVTNTPIFVDNSLILADCYRILRDIIDNERKSDALALVSDLPQKPYVRHADLQLILNRINQLTRTFIEHVDKEGHDLYALRCVGDAIKGCYLAKIKIYNFEARKSKLDPAVIRQNICALADLTAYIMERLQHGEYHTWAGGFFDWLCACVNWSSSATRDAKLFSAGRLFNRVVEGPQYNPGLCKALEKKYLKTMDTGTLGAIKKHYDIKL